jgi:hypothetical protein
MTILNSKTAGRNGGADFKKKLETDFRMGVLTHCCHNRPIKFSQSSSTSEASLIYTLNQELIC